MAETIEQVVPGCWLLYMAALVRTTSSGYVALVATRPAKDPLKKLLLEEDTNIVAIKMWCEVCIINMSSTLDRPF